MAIYPIRTFGDPVLRVETKTVTYVDDVVRSLVQDMIETMYEAPGVGLAANQIGITRKIAVFDAQDGLGPRAMINPEIVEVSGEWEYEEGCLSVPGHWWPIKRPGFARARALDLDGEEVEYAGDGLLGRVLQHEIDHLDQRLLIDWKDGKHSEFSLAQLRRVCPCAACRTEREQQGSNPLRILKADPTGVRVVSARLVGTYAIQFDWSDGHNTGIFDFRFLRSLDAG